MSHVSDVQQSPRLDHLVQIQQQLQSSNELDQIIGEDAYARISQKSQRIINQQALNYARSEDPHVQGFSDLTDKLKYRYLAQAIGEYIVAEGAKRMRGSIGLSPSAAASGYSGSYGGPGPSSAYQGAYASASGAAPVVPEEEEEGDDDSPRPPQASAAAASAAPRNNVQGLARTSTGVFAYQIIEMIAKASTCLRTSDLEQELDELQDLVDDLPADTAARITIRDILTVRIERIRSNEAEAIIPEVPVEDIKAMFTLARESALQATTLDECDAAQAQLEGVQNLINEFPGDSTPRRSFKESLTNMVDAASDKLLLKRKQIATRLIDNF